MIQPVECGGCEHKLPGQYPALKQNCNRIADKLAGLLGGGHHTLLSIFGKSTCNVQIVALKQGSRQLDWYTTAYTTGGWDTTSTLPDTAEYQSFCSWGKTMDDRTRYEAVRSRLRAMGEGTAHQVHNSMEPTPYSVREVQSTLDEMVLAEQDEFGKVGNVYRWKKHYRFRMGV